MELKLGETIKTLRKRDVRTQEALADALGITSQAVSRWESGSAYPDMELIPAIANYFGITIDELFGYECSRDKKVDKIIQRIKSYGIEARGDDEWVDECLAILRNGLAEFPQNESLLITLAETLSSAGWRRQGEWLYYDDEGYMQHSYDTHKKNEYWTEAVKICERLLDTTHDSGIINRAVNILVMLYRNFGEVDKAVAYASRASDIAHSRELLLAFAADGKAEAKYIGDALLEMAAEFAQQLVYGLVNNIHNYETDMPIEKVKGAIAIFDLICDDGNYGKHNGSLIELYLYLSRLQWEYGYHDDAFASLDKAYSCALALDEICPGKEHFYGGTLVKHSSYGIPVNEKPAVRTVHCLPDDWPMWCNPDYSEVEREIKADPRWKLWEEKCRSHV